MKRPDLHTITFSSFTPHHHEAFFSALTVCQQHTGRDGLQMMGGFFIFFFHCQVNALLVRAVKGFLGMPLVCDGNTELLLSFNDSQVTADTFSKRSIRVVDAITACTSSLAHGGVYTQERVYSSLL